LEQRREYNLPTYIVFLDYNKACDRVDHMKLWEILEQCEIPKTLINAIKSICVNTKICFPVDQEIESCILLNVNEGLCQGGGCH
jgi:hypothetical protein